MADGHADGGEPGAAVGRQPPASLLGGRPAPRPRSRRPGPAPRPRPRAAACPCPSRRCPAAVPIGSTSAQRPSPPVHAVQRGDRACRPRRGPAGPASGRTPSSRPSAPTALGERGVVEGSALHRHPVPVDRRDRRTGAPQRCTSQPARPARHAGRGRRPHVTRLPPRPSDGVVRRPSPGRVVERGSRPAGRAGAVQQPDRGQHAVVPDLQQRAVDRVVVEAQVPARRRPRAAATRSPPGRSHRRSTATVSSAARHARPSSVAARTPRDATGARRRPPRSCRRPPQPGRRRPGSAPGRAPRAARASTTTTQAMPPPTHDQVTPNAAALAPARRSPSRGPPATTTMKTPCIRPRISSGA